jgi:aldehyde dehydrogenase (NAD+)
MKDKVVDTPMTVGPAKSRIVYEPLGCVLIIGSWNYPIFTTLLPLVNAIAAGNTCVIKPSEVGPYSSNAMKKLIFRWLDTNCFVPIEG